MIEALYNWIASFPGFSGICFQVDALAGTCGAGGIFCRGEELLHRQEDILGGTVSRRRLTALVRLRLAADPDSPMPQCLLDFSRWVHTAPPVFGQEQTVKAEKGRLYAADHTGVRTYEIQVVLEFTTREDQI